MNVFGTVKTSINTREAAERYGVEVNRHGKALCPFHNDRNPSLFVDDDHYHCFACGEHGDVIDFTSKLCGMSMLDAAKKLAYDFGITQDKPPDKVLQEKQNRKSEAQRLRENEKLCFSALLIKPQDRYRAESNRQIKEAGCRTRSDSIRVMEALFTATPEFFKGKKRSELKEFFGEALEFIKQNQAPETIISAVVHLDEETPHMHLCFVPLTEDKRLSAKDIAGNKKKLTQWQDKYWEHMVKKYPTLERGETASETGRKHIPTRVFKQMSRLNKQHDKLVEMLSDMKFTNYKDKTAQIVAFLEKYIPDVSAMETQMKKYEKFFKAASGKQKALEKENAELTEALEKSEQQSTLKKLQEARLLNDYERIKGVLDRIPPEIIKAYTHRSTQKHDINR